MPSKAERVTRYQQAVVAQATQVIASMGLDSFDDLHPRMLRRRIAHGQVESYADLVHTLAPGELLAEPPATWAGDWAAADPDRFTP